MYHYLGSYATGVALGDSGRSEAEPLKPDWLHAREDEFQVEGETGEDGVK